jgi:hypothetical protein
MSGGNLADRVEGIVHEDTQVHDAGVDLTVAAIAVIEDPGRVDFGGGELDTASFDRVPTELRNPGDDYEWWHLTEGQYMIEYNEALTGDQSVWLQPRHELRERGGAHPTVRIDELGPMPLSVSRGGLYVKENARVSTLLSE